MATVSDPYIWLAINVYRQAFKDIESYYTGKGNNDDMLGGRDALKWIKKMNGTFRVMSTCSNMPIDRLHQACIHKITKIRDRAFYDRYDPIPE